MMRRRLLMVLIPIIILSSFSLGFGKAAVELLSFTALHMGNYVRLSWETASEFDNAGFHIQRREGNQIQFERISPFMPSQGDPSSSNSYIYDDEDITIGKIYFYRLESVSADGSSEYSDVLAINLQQQNTATHTLTPVIVPTMTSTGDANTVTPTSPSSVNTPTPTQTIAGTAPSGTRTATPPLPPTATGTQASPTPAATGTSEVAETATPTRTTTLMPLPSITLLFPIQSVTPTSTLTAIANAGAQTIQTPSANGGSDGISLRIKVLIAVIILLWLLLFGFIILYFRRISR